MTHSEIVVVGRVQRRLESEGDHLESMVSFEYAEPLAVKVVKVLKGDAAGDIRITTDIMCYRSFNLEDFKPGETFVFPISGKTESGLHVLPSCSHSAAKLVDGKLYTNELVRGGGRRLAPYMSLTAVRVLLPLGLLHRAGQYLVAGFLLVSIPMLITHRVRRRAVLDPIDSARSLNLRSWLAILWMLVCGGICIFLSLLHIGPLTLAIGVALALAFALAAAGLAFRWRWTEGFSYGLALLWIGACVVGTWSSLDDYFAVFERIQKPTVIFMTIVVLTVIGMLWYANAVRRRFSASRGPA